MAGPISLKALVHAITSAVSAAQADVERAQLVNLGRYFDEQRRPKIMKVRLPTGSAAPQPPTAAPGAPQDPPTDQPDGQLVGVPLLTLVPTTHLRIKEVEFRFEVDLGDLSDPHDQPEPAVFDGLKSGYRVISVDHAPRLLGRRRPAKVVVKVEAADPIEGVARLVGELNKFVGMPVAEGPAPTKPAENPPGR